MLSHCCVVGGARPARTAAAAAAVVVATAGGCRPTEVYQHRLYCTVLDDSRSAIPTFTALISDMYSLLLLSKVSDNVNTGRGQG